MTKKDYEVIARALKISVEETKNFDPKVQIAREQLHGNIVRDLQSALYSDNPNFNKQKFWNAIFK